ncbi:hypothetical protein BD779DRAFT_96121 [Infundibulicybe gibba]|nr:hypothetical protein BD779DRAFT_96121 [Infundibulicybe gibba]
MYIAIGFALIYGSLIIIMGVHCGIPHAIVWDPALGMVQCRSVNRVVFPVIGVDIMSDVFLVTIPLTTLWRLKLPRNQHRLVLAGFSSGIWTTAASVAATVIILRFPNNPDDTFSRAVLPHVEVYTTTNLNHINNPSYRPSSHCFLAIFWSQSPRFIGSFGKSRTLRVLPAILSRVVIHQNQDVILRMWHQLPSY